MFGYCNDYVYNPGFQIPELTSKSTSMQSCPVKVYLQVFYGKANSSFDHKIIFCDY